MALLKIENSNNEIVAYTSNIDNLSSYSTLGNVSIVEDSYEGLIYCYDNNEFEDYKYIDFRKRMKAIYNVIGEDPLYIRHLAEHKILPYNRCVELFGVEETNNFIRKYSEKIKKIREAIVSDVYTYIKNNGNLFNGLDYKIFVAYNDYFNSYILYENMEIFSFLTMLYGNNIKEINMLNISGDNIESYYIVNKTYLKLVLKDIPYQNTTLLNFLDNLAPSDPVFSLYWNNISWIHSNNPMVLELKTNLGISDSDFNNIFMMSVFKYISNF